MIQSGYSTLCFFMAPLPSILTNFQISTSSLAWIQAFCDESEIIQYPTNPDSDQLLKLDNCSFKWGKPDKADEENFQLSKINLALFRNEYVVILGKTGKSVLVNVKDLEKRHWLKLSRVRCSILMVSWTLKENKVFVPKSLGYCRYNEF